MIPPRLRQVTMTFLALLAVGLHASASTITFDNAVAAPLGAPPVEDEGVGFEYKNLPPGVLDALLTQGYAFGGRTAVPPPISLPGNLPVELGLIVEPTLCLLFLPVPCIDNGTNWLAIEQPISLIKEVIPSSLAILSFQASQVFEHPELCAPADGCFNAVSLNVYGLRGGAVVASNSFTLSYGFQTFTLTDPEGDWGNVGRVVFEPVGAPGQPAILAIDNIVVPEPASLTLLAAGLFAVSIRRRRRI